MPNQTSSNPISSTNLRTSDDSHVGNETGQVTEKSPISSFLDDFDLDAFICSSSARRQNVEPESPSSSTKSRLASPASLHQVTSPTNLTPPSPLAGNFQNPVPGGYGKPFPRKLFFDSMMEKKERNEKIERVLSASVCGKN